MADVLVAELIALGTQVVLASSRAPTGSLPIRGSLGSRQRESLDEAAISSIRLAELAAGPHATADSEDRARRQDRLQRTEAAFSPLPADSDAARAYGRIDPAAVSGGRKARGTRAVALLIVATACAAKLPLYTRNPGDFRGLADIVEVITI